MAIATIGPGGPRSDINMTPLIDVLLVLLIIFMLLTPLAPMGLETLVPQPDAKPSPKPPLLAIVIQIEPGSVLHINQEVVTEQELGPRLLEIFKIRAQKVCFVKGDDRLEFQEVARVIDIAKGAGAQKIGLLTGKTTL